MTESQSPVYSPDGQWLWSGREWIPAPPASPQPVSQDNLTIGTSVAEDATAQAAPTQATGSSLVRQWCPTCVGGSWHTKSCSQVNYAAPHREATEPSGDDLTLPPGPSCPRCGHGSRHQETCPARNAMAATAMDESHLQHGSATARRTESRSDALAKRLLVVFLVLVVAFMAWGLKKLDDSGGASANQAQSIDLRTATCAQIEALPDSNRINGEKASLEIQARNEGLTVTTEMENAFIARVNSLCDEDPSALYALQASAAYVDVTGGP